MKIFVVLLSMSIILPVILQAFDSICVSSVFHGTIVNTNPFQLFAYAQNNTLYQGNTNTGTGINTGVTNITTESDLPNAAGVPALVPKSEQSQAVHTEQHKKTVPLSWLTLHSQSHMKGARIALIVPVFTATAYNNAFYLFYKHYAGVRSGENITHNTSLLSGLVTSPKSSRSDAIVASAYAMQYLAKHLALLTPKNNVTVLTGIDVDGGSIFMDTKNTTNRYDILILGHQEYVTQQEYNNLGTFVANGGTMILLDGNVFYAQVGYDRITDTITLIKGHGWAFNGRSAWISVGERWKDETSQWVGSTSLCSSCRITFANNPVCLPAS
jgi:hypothetical protein